MLITGSLRASAENKLPFFFSPALRGTSNIFAAANNLYFYSDLVGVGAKWHIQELLG